MRTEELLDGIRVRPFRVGGNHGIQELHESLGGAHREIVDRMTDDVGVDMLGEMEADRKTAWARALRVVVGNGWNSRKVREAGRRRRGIPVQMRRPRQRSGLRGGRKRALQQDTLRMRGSKPRMNSTIGFVEHRKGFAAERQEFFVRGQGHGSVLRAVFDLLPPARRARTPWIPALRFATAGMTVPISRGYFSADCSG